MRIAVTGASGLIGSALTASLVADGHTVIRLVRRETHAADEARWNPMSGEADLAKLEGVESIVHLAGAGIGDHRWTESYKDLIRESRVAGTRSIARIAAQLEHKPASLISGSAMGYYGDRGDEELDESSSKGHGFLSDVVADWESAADPARDAGIRVAHPRTGLVVSGSGGAWERMIKLTRFGLAGRMGPGSQWWSFISIHDQVRALRFLIESEVLRGPVNLVSPYPVTNLEAVKTLAELMHRPAIFPAPTFALRMVLGEFSSEVLSSHKVVPRVLNETGFTWRDPTIGDATRAALQP